jgi:hypothetical protein
MARKKKKAPLPATPPEFVKIYSPAQGTTVGSPLTILVACRLPLGASVQISVSTPGTLGSPTPVPVPLILGPTFSVSVTLSPGTNVIEVQIVDGVTNPSDQLIVTN